MIQNNTQELHALQREALQRLKQVRADAQKLREDFLTKCLAQYAESNDNQKAKLIQRIIRAESQHQVYTKIKNIRGRDGSAFSLTTLKVPKDRTIIGTDEIKDLPDNDEYWETIVVPEEIEQLLIRRNQQHFSQAEGTPFTQPPLRAAVGYRC